MRRGFRVTGRVQGVGFRWWTRNTADSLGVRGTVRNCPDGSVEVHAEGSEEAIEYLERRLRKGPSAARVETLEEIESGDPLPDEFRIIH